jgi:hypothetical protein
MRRIPKSCRMRSVDAFPSRGTLLRKVFENNLNHFAPSITTFTLPTRPWTTPKVCATVIRASSWVNRSNLWRTVSISLSPSNFFVNFSTAHQTTNNTYVTAHLLSRPCLICLDARASTERNSIIILTAISINIGVGGIIV